MTTQKQETRRVPIPGDIITCQEQLDALPMDSHLRSLNGGLHWKKANHEQVPGWHNSKTGWLVSGEEWATVFATLGQQVVVDTINRPIEETPEQFAARFRDVVLWSEEHHYGSDNISTRVLKDLGDEFAFKPTVGMRLHNNHDLESLPDGTRVYTGDPAVADSFGLWVRKSGKWVKVFGGDVARKASNNPVIIDALPDPEFPDEPGRAKTEPDDWWLRAPTDEDHEKTFDLRRKAWERGWREKSDNGWCATYESLIKRAGLDPSVIEAQLPWGIHYGDTLTPDQVFTLPVGVVLYSIDPVGVYRRDARSRNRAGTLLITEEKGRKNYADRMILTAPDPGGIDQMERFRLSGYLMPVFTHDMLDELPTGSMIGYRSSRDRYIKNEDATWVTCDENGRPRSSHLYNSDAFASAQPAYGVIRIGEPA